MEIPSMLLPDPEHLRLDSLAVASDTRTLSLVLASSQTTSMCTPPLLHRPISKAMRHRTDATELTTSEGMPASWKVVTGLPSPGMRKTRAMVSRIVSVIVFEENMKW